MIANAAILNIIVKYKITVDELVHGKIGPIYKRILYDIGIKRQSGKMYYRLHKKIFPSYLKTLNFKVYNDLLPVKNKFYSYCLDSEVNVTCPLCHIPIESTLHLFSQCSKLEKL